MGTRIGVDTGGTFTDLVGLDEASGRTHVLKTASTPDDPGRAIIDGLRQGEAEGLWRLGDLSLIVHGTTVATNTLLERRGARTALVTTAGFRDVLAIGRQNRPRLYDLRSRRPEPLVPRQLRLEITERTGPTGEVERPIDEAEVRRVARRLEDLNVEAVAVGLLHSHTNPANELAAGRLLGEAMPGVTVCLSHRLSGEPGEYERHSTAAAGAFVQPVVETYLAKLEATLRSIGVAAPVFVMKSGGGVSAAAAVAERCIETALSGPAGGVRACVDLAERVPDGNLVAADMGGTSFDVAVVAGGRPQLAREASIGGLPLRMPMLDIHTIGAGGGSIGWVDAGQALRVGPHSAGASPGPACYGLGGEEPTVTDANLVLGRLSADSPLAGGRTLDRERAERAIHRIAKPLGLSLQAAAAGVLRVANSAMVAALRKLTIERGVDPRGYALGAYGGAGPLHAAELAVELGARTVVLPESPGVFSAVGLLLADLREDRYAWLKLPWNEEAANEAARVSRLLAADAADELAAAASLSTPSVSRRAVALRYRGQTTDLQIEWQGEAAPDVKPVAERFHSQHQSRYGFARRDHPIEIAGVAVTVEAPLPRQELVAGGAAIADDETTRPVWFGEGFVNARVIRRTAMRHEEPVDGPAIIEQPDTVTVVPPGWKATIKEKGELLLTA